MIDYQKDYLGKNLNSLSQLGNTLCDGGVDISISGRIGYNVLYKPTSYWLDLQHRVDKTFESVDGLNHCVRAYEMDRGEDYILGGTKKQLRTLKFLVIVFTTLISIGLKFKRN